MPVSDPPAIYAKCLDASGDWIAGFSKGNNNCAIMVDTDGLPFSGVKLRTFVYTRKLTLKGFQTNVLETDAEQYNDGKPQVIFSHTFDKSSTASLMTFLSDRMQTRINQFAKMGLTNLALAGGSYLGSQVGFPTEGGLLARTVATQLIPDNLLSKFDARLRTVLGAQVVAVQYNVSVCDFQMLDCSDESTGVLELIR